MCSFHLKISHDRWSVLSQRIMNNDIVAFNDMTFISNFFQTISELVKKIIWTTTHARRQGNSRFLSSGK
jgi:trehalose-6-phosphate synthase